MLVVGDSLIRKRLNDLARELGLASEEDAINYLLNIYGRYGSAIKYAKILEESARQVRELAGEFKKTIEATNELKALCREANELEELMNTLGKPYVTHCLSTGRVEEIKKVINAVLNFCSLSR
mgnify:FL=1